MTFGTPNLSAPRKRPKCRRYDCGKAGKLTAHEIALRVGITVEAARCRVRSGLRGDALAAPAYEALRRNRVECRSPLMRKALRIARQFPDRVPSRRELREAYPMSDAAAGKWQNALREAMEAA